MPLYTVTVPDATPPIVVIGGGIAGLSLTHALARAGAEVVLLERGRLGRQGASSLPAALLNPHRGRSGRAQPLDLAGLAAFWRTAAELEGQGLSSGATRSGVLRIASSPRQARQWGRLTTEVGTDVRWLEAAEIAAPYHAPYGGMLVAAGGWVVPELFLSALAQAAQQRGAELREGVRALQISGRQGALKIVTDVGAVAASQAVLCVGAEATPALPLPPLERVAGEIVTLNAANHPPLPHPLAGAVYGVQSGERAFVGGNHRDAGTADDSSSLRLRRSFGWFVPALAAAEVVATWSGVRARADGNEPRMEALGGGVWFFGALAGRGFLCAPLLARRLAHALTSS